jgi:hypothetical protein
LRALPPEVTSFGPPNPNVCTVALICNVFKDTKLYNFPKCVKMERLEWLKVECKTWKLS